jgi:pimeloyl-CoA synthetase
MENFEEKVQAKLQETILKQIADCRYVEYQHSQKRGVPDDIISKAWEAIDWEEVVTYVRKEIQDKVCQTIVQNMLTEVKTDVKAILSVEGVRQKIRMEAYPIIKKIIEIEG